MNWHYVDQGQQVGPVDEQHFNQLVSAGTIYADTLVWREGMAEWTPYGRIGGQASASAATPNTAPEAVCAECGGIFPVSETIEYGKARVCANCKPIFLQKLREGAEINSGEFRYAGFWLRFGAKFVDGLILRAAGAMMGFAIGLMGTQAGVSVVGVQLIAGGVGILVAMAYNVFMVGKYGATLGKMACKIKIVCADGSPVSYKRALGRFFAEMLSGCPTLLIGYIMAGFDEQKRSLHDRICNTRVIYK